MFYIKPTTKSNNILLAYKYYHSICTLKDCCFFVIILRCLLTMHKLNDKILRSEVYFVHGVSSCFV